MTKLCVRCNVPFKLTTVPCPDRYVSKQTQDGFETGPSFSCAVLHYGERCPRCGGEVYQGG